MEPSGQAELVMAFANTLDVEEGTDELTSQAGLARWLDTPRVDAGDHRLALDLRAGIRERLSLDGDADPEIVAAGDAALRELPVQVGLGGRLTPAGSTTAARRALGMLAVAWTHLVITEESQRIKRCAEHSCGWVFWDGSKNRSRRWCSMRVCGNRNKARAFASRQRAAQ
ncbi:CGNR zinc finger domain-containing protein [Pseudonocardiaceae bacterium YIM PH 21723]|nr:CGNR zinc finger domain-containing protein [Pseudonocardiaceae bacterium YIM PH 21723]